MLAARGSALHRNAMPAQQRAPQAGLTLLEMLVTLALVGMLTSVLMQGMVLVGRIERQLDEGNLGSQANQLPIEWLRAALESALPTIPDSPERLIGRAEDLSFLTTSAPGLDLSGTASFRLTLRRDAASATTHLELQRIDAKGVPKAWQVAQWDGMQGGISYLDASGRWQSAWPPAEPDAPTLPIAIRVDGPYRDQPLLIAGMAISPWPLPTLRRLQVD
jgi:prepilin-type N-terminal cleavage/methylation domain-containing protein